MTRQNALEVRSVLKRFPSGDQTITVLDRVSFSIPDGSACAIMGPSGSGKTTLLGLCAGLDVPDEGAIVLQNTNLGSLNEEGRARLRRESLGFVFQSFRLVSTLTALENVMVPLELLGEKKIQEKAAKMLERVGLRDRLHHFPAQLSGGEQQRVGIARATVHKPKILFADEPTGNLDLETGHQITKLLFEFNKSDGLTLVMVTHNEELARQTGRILHLSGGSLVSDSHA